MGTGGPHPGRRQFPKHPSCFILWADSVQPPQVAFAVQASGKLVLHLRAAIKVPGWPHLSHVVLALFPRQPFTDGGWVGTFHLCLSQGAWESEHKPDFQPAGLSQKRQSEEPKQPLDASCSVLEFYFVHILPLQTLDKMIRYSWGTHTSMLVYCLVP